MATTITVLSQKGGTGKTTTVRTLSILDYRPDLAADYLDVADELLKRLKLKDARRRLKALRAG